MCHSLNAQWVYNYHDQADTVENNILYFDKYDLTACFNDGFINISVGQKKNHLMESYLVQDYWAISKDSRNEYRLILDDVEFNWEDSSGWIEKINNYPSNTIRIHKPEMYYEGGLSFERISDELVIINEFKADSIDPFAGPLRSLQYPDEDSLIFDEETGYVEAIYAPSIPGYERSGVFNYKTGNWLIEPIYRKCQLTREGYLLTFANRNENSNLEQGCQYSLLNFDAEILFANYYTNDLLDVKSQLRLIAPDNGFDTCAKILFAYEKYFDDYSIESLFLTQHQNKYRVYNSFYDDYWLDNEFITKPADFIHYNPDFDFLYWVDNDSIFLDWSDKVYSVAIEDGYIELLINHVDQVGHIEDEYFLPYIVSEEVMIHSNCETINHKIVLNENDKETSICHSSLLLEGSQLILNDNCLFKLKTIDRNDIGNIYRPEYFNNHFESENSSIWTKKDSVWTKSTTNYATIEPVPFGYVVSTPKIYQEAHDHQEAIDQPKRYLLLDTNLRAISFMDFFDFEDAKVHAFGVSLKTDTGRFLVNHQGKAVSNAEWDKFQLVDGEVIAIRFKAGTTIIEKQMVIDLGLR